MHHSMGTACFIFLIFAVLGGCTTVRLHHPPADLLQGLKPGDILDTRTGKKISFEDLMKDLSGVRVIYVGEVHTSVEDHRIQQQIMEALYDRNPSLTLAMEMFPRKVQPVLDQWSTGMFKEDAFLREVQWMHNWGFPFQLYRGLLTGARDRRMEVLALNAPRRVVSKIAQGGLSSLTAEERTQIASDINLSDSKHREYVREQYEQHAEGNIKDFESFYEAQLAWEETMAETIAQKLHSSSPEDQILVIIGNGHILYGWGVPQRAERRIGHSYKTVLPVPARSLSETLEDGVADYIWVTEGKELAHPPHRGRLGVTLRPASSGEGLEVMGVIPDSPAAKAGIRKGDAIYQVNEVPIQTVEDIHRAVTSEKAGTSHRIRIRRGAEDISLQVVLTPSSEAPQ